MATTGLSHGSGSLSNYHSYRLWVHDTDGNEHAPDVMCTFQPSTIYILFVPCPHAKLPAIPTQKEQLSLASGGQISLHGSIASLFKLDNLREVHVVKVAPEAVALDVVEITFRGQYIGRNDMFRLTSSLKQQCLYVGRSVQVGGIRCQISQLWLKSNGKEVASGYATASTKVVYRSSACQIHMLIQMSAVTLFARILYDETDVDAFPPHIQHLYQVILQNEVGVDLLLQLTTIRGYLNNFLDKIELLETSMPRGHLSRALHGNVLEAVNLSLNVFDRHHLDRVFQRTGLGVLIISPGGGLFESSPELLKLSQQRICDNGIGCDLVCLAERRAHDAVIFRWQARDDTAEHRSPHASTRLTPMVSSSSLPGWTGSDTGESVFSPLVDRRRHGGDHPYFYARPTWIHTFLYDQDFILREALTPQWQEEPHVPARFMETSAVFSAEEGQRWRIAPAPRHETTPETLAEMEEHDRLIWLTAEDAMSSTRENQVNDGTQALRALNDGRSVSIGRDNSLVREMAQRASRHASKGSFVPSQATLQAANSPLVRDAPTTALGAATADKLASTSIPPSYTVGASLSESPIDPSLLHNAGVRRMARAWRRYAVKDNLLLSEQERRACDRLSGHPLVNPYLLRDAYNEFVGGNHNWKHVFPPAYLNSSTPFGPPWKSICRPACLPLTTDQLPSEVELTETHRVVSHYKLNAVSHWDGRPGPAGNATMMRQLFVLLQAQRMAQGFQLCVSRSRRGGRGGVLEESSDRSQTDSRSAAMARASAPTNNRVKSSNSNVLPDVLYMPLNAVASVDSPESDLDVAHWMSFGSHFHKLEYKQHENAVFVDIYRPLDHLHPRPLSYSYGLIPYRRSDAIAMETKFSPSALDGYNWNAADNLVSNREVATEPLSSNEIDSLRFWRVRFGVVPAHRFMTVAEAVSNFGRFLEDVHRVLKPYRVGLYLCFVVALCVYVCVCVCVCPGKSGSLEAVPLQFGPLTSDSSAEPVQVGAFAVTSMVEPTDERCLSDLQPSQVAAASDKHVLAQVTWLNVDPKGISGRDEWAGLYADTQRVVLEALEDAFDLILDVRHDEVQLAELDVGPRQRPAVLARQYLHRFNDGQAAHHGTPRSGLACLGRASCNHQLGSASHRALSAALPVPCTTKDYTCPFLRSVGCKRPMKRSADYCKTLLDWTFTHCVHEKTLKALCQCRDDPETQMSKSRRDISRRQESIAGAAGKKPKHRNNEQRS
ncbi:uncharacterized protein MONBRDRAFT_31201 [Monosiga brevicollis MX1]|uniref:Vacuolar membrane-associated protein Iml1 N-terminal domain-containing protein n=1 Tax=Monosiga brevicollis TaxID=81824 RepID=A9USC5_MONBE|nr:uncharacterized protein MONBRDRAFT_31201 [Monosiga brevicollis MX1]EDQ92077.1 predicted protein [Monosiga brevicollis MX1]|eukprot:XP_001743363.1 hypothetical protein [Monosiga brevicollis MX1]